MTYREKRAKVKERVQRVRGDLERQKWTFNCSETLDTEDSINYLLVP